MTRCTVGMDGGARRRRGKEKPNAQTRWETGESPRRPAEARLGGNQRALREAKVWGNRAPASGTGKAWPSEQSPDGQMLHHPGVRLL